MFYLVFTARVLLVAVFLSAALSKTVRRGSFREFSDSLTSLRLFPRRLSAAAAILTVLTEAVTAVLLTIPEAVFTVAGFAAALTLMLIFVAGISTARRGGRQISCRCFGASRKPLGVPHLVRNSFLAVVATAGGVLAVLSPDSSAVHPAGLAIAAFSAGICALLVIRMDDLLVLAPALR